MLMCPFLTAARPSRAGCAAVITCVSGTVLIRGEGMWPLDAEVRLPIGHAVAKA